ncbi:hypothetical protein [Mycobacterium sp. 1081908.1]|uniref:hypothetical protein n=1 Tax=Mycobacterium sp. 1081908.1 TaxID=1834066 RepID=UPI00080012B7|nr:hypothetical protein [Mycobacterium sp. 1081908.1]OBK46773.1 hypothetical protein A5655_08720 [Mycobacterium sp. 1081908.1]
MIGTPALLVGGYQMWWAFRILQLAPLAALWFGTPGRVAIVVLSFAAPIALALVALPLTTRQGRQRDSLDAGTPVASGSFP